MFVCSFTQGLYDVQSPSGKTGLCFEDSDQFGPSKLNCRTGDLTEISDRLGWFWDGYSEWRKIGRPTTGAILSTPIGDVRKVLFPQPVGEKQ